MYILSDRFLGNIKNTKNSYLMGDMFYYTNDGKNYKKSQINKKDIYEGVLSKFYTSAKIYHWIRKDTFSNIEKAIDKESNSIYLEVHLSEDNEIDTIYSVNKEDVDYNKFVETFEVISPTKNEKVIAYSDGNNCMFGGDDNFFENASMSYTANICFPNMIYRKDVGQYVFKNETIFTYKSKEDIVNSLDDFIRLKKLEG